MAKASPSRLIRVFSSITFRMVLIYTFVFMLSVGGLFSFVFWTTSRYADQQIEAAIQADVTGFQDAYQRSGLPALIMAVNRRVAPGTRTDGIYLLVDQFGNTLAGNLQSWPVVRQKPADVWVTFSIRDPSNTEQEYGEARGMQFILPGNTKLLVGRDVRSAHHFRTQLLKSLNVGLALTAALGLIGGFIFSRTIMRRIESISRTCRRIMSGELSQRVPVRGQNDEIGQLSESINAMLDQIERLMRGMQQVSDNVAHDLRTPLNRLRSRLESVARKIDNPTSREAVEDAISDVDSLLGTFNSLLRIARAEAGSQKSFSELDLPAIAEEVADLYAPLAEDKGLGFVTDVRPGVMARGDKNLVAQAVANIVDNAIKYTDAGSVTLSVTERDGRPMFVIADTGPGVPDAYKAKVLDRLYRMEESRTSPGSGLGLSLVSAVAKSHGLELTLLDNQPGLRVELKFPKRDVTALPAPVKAITHRPATDEQPRAAAE